MQRMCRNTFDPCAVEHQGNFDKERVDHLITHVKDSMPCLGLQHSWCDSPNIETNPGDIFTVWSRVVFSHGSLNSTIKKVADPTPIVCQQFLLSMKLRSGRLNSSRLGEILILKHQPTIDSR